MQLLLLLLLPFLVHQSVQSSYFCNLRCVMGGTHTACYYEPCLPHKNCGPKYEMKQLNDSERSNIVEHHNKYRQKVASGSDPRGGNGKAKNMKALSYSKELEFVAQCWANQCNQNGAHDQCRAIKDFEAVGQNMFMKSIRIDTGPEDLKRAVEVWYEEIEHTNAEVIKSYKHDSEYGHFTQVVWAKTQYVGCGRTIYGSADRMSVLIICNYAESGNFLSESVYEFGEPCSSCGKCNKEFKALCGEIRPVDKDQWEAPFKLTASSVNISIGLFLCATIFSLLCSKVLH